MEESVKRIDREIANLKREIRTCENARKLALFEAIKKAFDKIRKARKNGKLDR